MPTGSYVRTPESRAITSAALRGRQFSPETRALISAAKTGERNAAWSGDDISYRGVHKRARKALAGRPCEHCGSRGRVEAALRHGVGTLFDGPLRYSVDPGDYLPLCRPCHHRYDGIARNLPHHPKVQLVPA